MTAVQESKRWYSQAGGNRAVGGLCTWDSFSFSFIYWGCRAPKSMLLSSFFFFPEVNYKCYSIKLTHGYKPFIAILHSFRATGSRRIPKNIYTFDPIIYCTLWKVIGRERKILKGALGTVEGGCVIVKV